MTKTEFKVGELVKDRYRVLEVIDAGEMGVLYRVSDEDKNGQIVALKMVRLDTVETETRGSIERLQRKFQRLTQLRHPNLVEVYDCGTLTDAGKLYFTMAWVKGQGLEPSLHPLEPAASIPVMIQVCRALAYLHACGLIHGALNPSKVLMSGEGVKLVGFGVPLEARSPEDRARYDVLGYTAPEVEGQRSIDYRADLYSLGAMWYALLLGEPPLFIKDSDLLIQFSLAEALEAQEQVPPAITTVITRLLVGSPADRYPSANAVIAAVNEITGSTHALETRERARRDALRGGFVDREAELEALQAAWEQARAGEGKLVLLSGESGAGKTRLVEEFVVQAELEGALVVRGQCVEREGTAYRPWREVLRLLLRYVERADWAGLEVEHMGPVLATLLPELWERGYMAGLEPPPDLEPRAAQQRLNDTISRVLQALAVQRPTVIVIEDAHWADEASLALLSFLTQIPEQAGLQVCVTYSPEGAGPDHPLIGMGREWMQVIQVEGLSPAATAALVRSMLSLERAPASLAERVQQATGGNPFFVQELIRSWAEEGEVLERTAEGWRVNTTALDETSLPESIPQVIGRRLERRSTKAREVLRWAAAVGPVFWDGLLAEIGQVSRAEVQAALQEGLDQELIVERDLSMFAGEREYTFTHPAVRAVSYEGIAAEEGQEYHSRAAAWLIVRSGEERERLGLIADQLEGAGQADQVVAYLHRAGEQAAAQFANAEAVAYLSRALNLMPKDDAIERLAERYDLLLTREKMYDLQGAREAQRRDLAALQELAEALDDDRRRTEAALRRAYYASMTGEYQLAMAVAQEAIRLAQAAQDTRSEAEGYLRWGGILRVAGDLKAAQPHLERAVALARKAGLRHTEAESLRNLGAAFIYQQAYAEAKSHYEQALRIYRELGDRVGESKALGSLGDIPWRLGEYDEARAYFEQALHLTRELGDRLHEGVVLGNLSLVSRLQGDAEAAREYGQQALHTVQEAGDPRNQGYNLTLLGHAMASLGRLAEASEFYQQALTLRRELGQHELAMESLAGLARVSLVEGDLAQAQAQVEEILSYLETNTLEGTEEPFWIHLTCYYVLRANQDPRAQGILDTARRLLREKAARISDEGLRRSFLENVPAHREIMGDLAEGEQIVERILLRSEAVLSPEESAKEREEGKTAEQLAAELAEAHRRIAELETSEAQRKRVEETLWESEKRFRSITETASDAVIIFDAYQHIFLWNQAAERIFGYRVGEARGRPLASMLSKEFHALFRGAIEQVVETGGSDLLGKVVEVVGVRKDGSEFPLELSLATWKTKEKVFFTAISRDITEMKEARAQEESIRLQQEVIEAQKQVIGELSTPIIPLLEGIIVMPLIGSIDTLRARDITRSLVAGIREHKARVVILDITGVPIVNSDVAAYLDKTIQAARLKGARAIVTGVSEAVAETIVDLGIDWSGIETMRDLQTGLRAALQSRRAR